MAEVRQDIELKLTRIFWEGQDDIWDLCAAESITPNQLEEYMAKDISPDIFDSCLAFFFVYGYEVEKYACQLMQRNPCLKKCDIMTEYWSIPVLPKGAFKSMYN